MLSVRADRKGWIDRHRGKTNDIGTGKTSSDDSGNLAAAASDNQYVEDMGNGVKLLEDDSPYIVYGGEKWLTDHQGPSCFHNPRQVLS
jgi:hypothetical protein